MSDFIRRASDAFRRRSSADSTDVPTSPDPPSAAKPLEQEPQNQTSESAQPQSHANEAFAGVATGIISLSRLSCLLYNNKIIQIMLQLRRSTTFGDGHTTRESIPGQRSNLARSNKILTGLLARRRIIVLAGVTGLLTLSL